MAGGWNPSSAKEMARLSYSVNTMVAGHQQQSYWPGLSGVYGFYTKISIPALRWKLWIFLDIRIPRKYEESWLRNSHARKPPSSSGKHIVSGPIVNVTSCFICAVNDVKQPGGGTIREIWIHEIVKSRSSKSTTPILFACSLSNFHDVRVAIWLLYSRYKFKMVARLRK